MWSIPRDLRDDPSGCPTIRGLAGWADFVRQSIRRRRGCMFCKYCGRKLQEGEVCSCRQQNGQAPGQPPLMQAPSQTAQKEEGSRSIPPSIKGFMLL